MSEGEGRKSWDVPRTEEGLQEVLGRLEECRAKGDEVGVGNGLLALSFLVKWVRSDNDQPPFVRSNELALEALESFRNAKHVPGQVRSLVAATAMTDPGTRERMLSEAETLAEGLEDESYLGSVVAARARALAMSDREQAAKLHWRALEIFRRTGNRRGQAQCLFSLSIGPGASEENLDAAIEAARIYREIGDRREASRCVTIAIMNAEKIGPLSNVEDLIREGLEDALAAGDRGQEGCFYDKLALVAASKGENEEAEKYRRWASDLKESDGRTPLERWKDDVEMTKTMISMAKAQGHKEAATTFQEELKRLKAAKPGAK